MNLMSIPARRIRLSAPIALWLCAAAYAAGAHAEIDWYSITLDNDSVVGNDNGYTNGIYLSWFDTPDNHAAKPGYLARWISWSLPDAGPSVVDASARTLGQVMITPNDITLENPPAPPDDLPYAGLLFYRDTFIEVYARHADSIAATIGIVGKYSFAEDAQKLVHDVIESDEPKGWDTQLDDEIVFQLSRGRVWKSWTSDSGRMDVLLGVDGSLGTISSSIGASLMWRYGSQLETTFATTLLGNGRAINPVATRSGWYWFAGINGQYVANQIFFDGNTYDDGESVDYEPYAVGIIAGLAHSWNKLSFTLAVSDLNVLEESDNDSAEEYSEFGTITLAWKLD